jgi:hypothetical protein
MLISFNTNSTIRHSSNAIITNNYYTATGGSAICSDDVEGSKCDDDAREGSKCDDDARDDENDRNYDDASDDDEKIVDEKNNDDSDDDNKKKKRKLTNFKELVKMKTRRYNRS